MQSFPSKMIYLYLYVAIFSLQSVNFLETGNHLFSSVASSLWLSQGPTGSQGSINSSWLMVPKIIYSAKIEVLWSGSNISF